MRSRRGVAIGKMHAFAVACPLPIRGSRSGFGLKFSCRRLSPLGVLMFNYADLVNHGLMIITGSVFLWESQRLLEGQHQWGNV